eukprot:353536-Chlamydomonas_euryale.AAC.9
MPLHTVPPILSLPYCPSHTVTTSTQPTPSAPWPVGDPELGAVEQVAAAAGRARRTQPHAAHVRSRPDLAHRERADGPAGQQARQVALLLRGGRVAHELVDAQVGVRTVRQPHGAACGADLLRRVRAGSGMRVWGLCERGRVVVVVAAVVVDPRHIRRGASRQLSCVSQQAAFSAMSCPLVPRRQLGCTADAAPW